MSVLLIESLPLLEIQCLQASISAHDIGPEDIGSLAAIWAKRRPGSLANKIDCSVPVVGVRQTRS